MRELLYKLWRFVTRQDLMDKLDRLQYSVDEIKQVSAENSSSEYVPLSARERAIRVFNGHPPFQGWPSTSGTFTTKGEKLYVKRLKKSS